jgi:hypothetical protein
MTTELPNRSDIVESDLQLCLVQLYKSSVIPSEYNVFIGKAFVGKLFQHPDSKWDSGPNSTGSTYDTMDQCFEEYKKLLI